MPGSWVLGALVTQLWSVAGLPDRPSVNSFLVQPFVNYNLKGGWAVTSAPIMTSNASLPGTKWTVPLGGGVSKTFKDDGQLMQLALLYYTNVVRPLTAPQTTLRISVESFVAGEARNRRSAAAPRGEIDYDFTST